MFVFDTGSIVVEWQTLHVASSTFATPPGLLLVPSLLDEPQPFSSAARESVLNSMKLSFLILMVIPPCVEFTDGY
jgi:hypothetical protein